MVAVSLLALLLLLQACAALLLRGHSSSGLRLTALHERMVKVKNLDNGEEISIESGKPMSLACTRANLRLSFQCKQGTCQSCEFLLDGKVTRSCITKVPNKAAITIKKK